MRKFHAATLTERVSETADSVRLTLSVPAEVADEYRYHQGQHLPVRAVIDGKTLRRTYSICASAGEQILRLGVRVQEGGVMSNYLASQLTVGDTVDVMPPFGHFYTELDPHQARVYAAFVAGSGITPILSIVKTTLETERDSRFVVFYGNRTRLTTMFSEDLWALKNRFPERLSLHFIMSREPADIDLYSGRLDAGKTRALYNAFLASATPQDVFVCGPDSMISEVTETLESLGIAHANIHSERFRAAQREPRPTPAADAVSPAAGTEVTIIMDGQRQVFHMEPDADSVLDAAQKAGIDLPYSCKGGVCSTCRTHLRDGVVDLEVNYALEDWELKQGFVLACQARPRTESLTLDYDKT